MRTRQRLILFAMRSLLVLSVFMAYVPWSASAQGTNLLANPGFEPPFPASIPGKDNCFIAHGWTAWFVNGTKAETDQGYLKAPEYKSATRHDAPFNRVRNGDTAQQWFNTAATHRAGVYQVVGNVTPGARYRFELWGMVWSCHYDLDRPKDAKNCDGARSGNPSPMHVRIGIDPRGGADPFSSSVVWSPEQEPVDDWRKFEVEAVAQGANITVFAYSAPEYRNLNNNVYLDDASLVMVSAPPTPKPQPTNTPKATATPTDTPEPTATFTPEATATPLPSPTPETATIRAESFEDRNGNGLRDAGEPFVAGARIQLLDAQNKVVATQLTDGANPVRFEGLVAGNYRVMEESAPGYAPISVNQWAVVVIAGAEVETLFANKALPTATPKPPATATVAASPTIARPSQPTATVVPVAAQAPRKGLGQWLYGISGLVLAAAAIAMLVLIRRRRA